MQLQGIISTEGESGIKYNELLEGSLSKTFLSRQIMLWEPEMGDPRELVNRRDSMLTFDLVRTDLSDIRTSSDRGRLFHQTVAASKEAKFIGSLQIPFEFLLPETADGEMQDSERLPPSLDKGALGKIEYSLTVTIRTIGVLNRSERSVFQEFWMVFVN
jgi:hypothetical protein